MTFEAGGRHWWAASHDGSNTHAPLDRSAPFLGFDAPSLLAIALRWKGLIAGVGLLTAIFTYVALLQVSPTYSAKTQVMLGAGAAQVIDIPNVVPEANTNIAFTESAVIVMQSSDVLRAVVRELNLDERKEFNPALQTPGLLDRVVGVWRASLKAIIPKGGSPDDTETALFGERDALSGTIRSLRKAISVHVLGESQVIEVRALSESPRLAATIADTLAQKYIDAQLETKYLAGDQATEWLEGRADELRDILKESEQRVADFSMSQVNGGQETVADLEPQLAKLVDSLTRLAAERADLMVRRDEVSRLFADGNFAALASTLGMPVVTELHAQISDLDVRIVRLQTQFGEHPSVQKLRDIRGYAALGIKSEVEGVLSALSVRIDILADRRAALGNQLQLARRELADREQAELQLLELEREVEASREVYNRFLLRLKETRERSQFQVADGWIVSAAEVPIIPAAPQKGKLTVIFAIGGSALTLLLFALFADNRPKVAGPREVAKFTGVASVGQIPHLPSVGGPLDLLERVRASPASTVANAVHRMRLSVAAKDPHQVNVIMVTSADHGEGKTTLCLLLAETFARTGTNTVLVSADPGNGSLAELLPYRETDTIGFDIVDFSDLEEQTQPEDGFTALLRTLKRRKVIIIDTPPVLISAEAFEIGLLANSTIVACAWDQTPNEALAQTIDALREARVDINAIAINKVPPKRMRQVDLRSRPIIPPRVAPPRALPHPQSVT